MFQGLESLPMGYFIVVIPLINDNDDGTYIGLISQLCYGTSHSFEYEIGRQLVKTPLATAINAFQPNT